MILRNVASMSGLSFFRSAVQFGINLVLAAFITPGEYGLVAFTAPFMALLGLLTDLGLSTAVVRQPELSREAAGAAFTLSGALGLAIASVLALLGFPLARVTGMHGLPGVMAGMSAALACSVLASIPRALLERRLAYGRVALIEGGAVFAAAPVAVALAFAGWGVYALVAYNLLVAALRSGLMVARTRRDFTPNLRLRATLPLLSFGGWLLATNLFNFAARNVDNILIGGFLGARAVGLYGLAYQVMIVPLTAITWPASGVLMATLSQKDTDPEDARGMICAVVAVTAALVFPAMAYLTFGAAFPVPRLLGARWGDSVGIVAVLAPVGAIQAVAAYNGPVLLARGAARLQFLAGLVNGGVLISTFWLSLPFGLMSLVHAYAAVAVALSAALFSLMVWKGELGWGRALGALAPALAATATGLLLAAIVTRLHTPTLGAWAAATAAYAVGVLGVYGLSLPTLLRHFGVLKSGRAPSAPVAA